MASGNIKGHLLEIVPTDDGDEVEGFVFSSAHLAEHWQMLDEFEGEGYERVLVIVRVDGDRKVEAYDYVLHRDP